MNFAAMIKMRIPIILLLAVLLANKTYGQADDDEFGAWYMYFWNTTFNAGPWGAQGDVQYRNWDLGGDLEQLLLRGGPTYQPTGSDVKMTLGYAYILSGEQGESTESRAEHRAYQEMLLPQKVGERFHLTHRFRYEQRAVEGQDMRTRWRYAFMANIPLNGTELDKGVYYIALYNALFVNGERNIGNGLSVELFDRNRSYAALGFGVSDKLKVQVGAMRQVSSNSKRWQLQVGLHQKL